MQAFLENNTILTPWVFDPRHIKFFQQDGLELDMLGKTISPEGGMS
jgi:hypothetical protein